MAKFDPSTYLEETPKKARKVEGFDPDAYLSPQSEEDAPDEPSQPSGGSSFDPNSYLENEGPVGPARAEELASKGAVAKEELEQIAKDTGADSKLLERIAPVYGLDVEGTITDPGLKAIGFLERSVGLQLPTFIHKKLQDDKTRKALDQLRELAEKRKSGLETAAEIGVGALSGFGLAGLVGKGLTAAGLGANALKAYNIASLFGGSAAAGLGASKEGEEVKDAATYAALGGGFGLAAYGLGKGVARLANRFGKRGAEKATKAIADVTGDVDEHLAKHADHYTARDKEFLDTLNSTKLPDEPYVSNKLKGELAENPEFKEQVIKEFGLENKVAKLSTEEADELVLKLKAQQELKSDIIELARDLTPNKVEKPSTLSESLGILRETAKRESPEFVAESFQRLQASKAALQIMAKKMAQELPIPASQTNLFVNFVQDGREIMSRIDERTGTHLTPWADKMGQKHNRFLLELKTLMNGAQKPLEAVEKTGLRKLSPEAISHLERTGNLEGFSAAQKEAFQGFQSLMERLRQRAEELGVRIDKINPDKAKVYVPRAQVDTAEAVHRVKQLAENVGVTPGAMTDEQFLRLESSAPKAYRQLKQAVSWLTGKEEFRSAGDLGKALQEALIPGKVDDVLRSKAVASMARSLEDGVPDVLRETDLNKLTVKWMYNTFRHAFYKDGLAELAHQKKLAEAAQDLDAVRYISKLEQDLLGGRSRTLKKEINDARIKFQIKAKDIQVKAEKAGKPLIASVARTISAAPELVNTLYSQVYPNFLGWSPKATIQNMAQTFYTTWPELGYVYGAPKVLAAQLKAVAQLTKGQSKKILEGKGQLSDAAYARMMDVLASSLEAGSIYRIGKDQLNKVTEFAMSAFEYSERFNRLVAVNVAEDVTQDLFKPGRAAKVSGFLDRMPKSYRSQIQKARSAGDQAKTRDLIENYLIGKTIFNYNHITMSEYGRSLGPFFSVFSKWPSAVAGDIYSQYERRGALGGSAEVMRKYLLPLVVAYQANSFLEFEDNPALQALLGKEGVAQGAPIRSILGVAEGDLFSPPAVSLATKAIKGVLSLDPYEFWKLGNEAVASYAPGAFFLRILGNDLPGVLQGERSTGTFFNKVMETIQPGTDLDEGIKDIISTKER